MQEVKVLSGVMDTESSIETVDLYDYLDALNITNALQGDSKTNYSTSLEGNIKITTYQPLGQNKVIGSEYVRETGKTYFIRYNSLSYHQIVEFDYNKKEERIIFENITDSNGSILDINASTYFSDIKILGDNILVLNSGEGEVLYIDIKRDRSDKLNKSDLTLIRRPLPDSPKVRYVDNPTITINNLRGKLFQFKSQVEYENNLNSVWSHTSDRVVPINEPSDGQGQNTLLSNSIEVTVPLGDITKAKVIRISVRSSNDAWLLFREIEYEDLIKLPLNINMIGGEEESYNPTTKEYKVIFKNDGAYPILDQVEVNSLYDAIPQKARALEVVNGNVIALGGITEGYDRPDVNMDAKVTYYEPNITNVVTDPSSDRFRNEAQRYSQGKNYVDYANWFLGKPLEGDAIIFEYTPRDQLQNILTIDYTVTLADENDGLKETLQRAVNKFNSYNLEGISFTQVTGVNDQYIDYRWYTSSQYWPKALTVKNKNTGTLSTQSINSLKNNSSYQLSLNLYDEYMRPFPIITSSSLKVNTDSIALTRGLLPQITTFIEGQAPEEARYYRIGITENRTTRKYVTLTGTVNSSTSEDYIIVNLKSLEHINENESDSIVNYEFTKGDRVNFLRIIDENGNTTRWFNSPVIDLDVVGFQVEVSGSDTNYLLKVRNTSLLNSYKTSMTGKEVVVEIYTPKPEDDEVNSIYYEIGDTYKIINGEFSERSVNIKTGDSYYRGRLFISSLVDKKPMYQLVADPNFSDNYASNYWSNGTPRAYNDNTGRVEYKGSIRYSGELIYGSDTNEINRFYVERIYGEKGGETTRKYGWIQGLIMRNNTLVSIQEHKVGVIPVYRSVIEDNQDNYLEADSGKIFGSVRYRASDYGCGSSKTSIAKIENVIYFVDDNECVPCRDTESNGTEPIGGKMLNYFKEYINIAKNKGAKILGYSHGYKGEYIVSIEELTEQLITLSFDDSVYLDPLPPLNSVEVRPTVKGTALYDWQTGIINYTHDTEDLGRDDIILDINGESKIIPLKIVQGDKTPNPIYFSTANNVNINSLVESNSAIITGINTPVEVSIVGGEYSKNGGSYTNVNGVAVDGDSFKVRTTSSAEYSTETEAVLTIGGVNGVFKVKTRPANVEPTNVNLTGKVNISPTSQIVAVLELTSKIMEDVITSFVIEYEEFGSIFTYTSGNVILAGGQTSVNITTPLMMSSGTIIRNGEIRSSNTTPQDSSIVNLEGGGTAVFQIFDMMLIPPSQP